MNIRPDTALYQVLSELLGSAGRAVRPAVSEAAMPSATAATKKATVAAAPASSTAAPASPGTPASGPAAIKPRGSIVNIIA
jgi:hypothetical protein